MATSYFKTSSQLKYMISLALHCKLLRVFGCQHDGAQIYFLILKSYNVLFVNTIQLISMPKMFPMGKIRALWTITKIMVHLWKNMYFLNMWKNARSGSCCWCRKLKVMEFNEEKQNNEEYPSFYDFIKFSSNQ